MKIAFLYDAIYPFQKGGGEKRIWDLSQRLAARGHEIHLYGIRSWDGPAVLRRDRVFLHGVVPSVPFYRGSRRSVAEAILFGAGLVPEIAKEKFDLVDCQQFPYFSAISARSVCLFRRTPMVLTWYEVWNDYWYEYLGWAGGIGKGMDRILARLTPHHIAISGPVRERLARLMPWNEVPVFPTGVDSRHIDGIEPSGESSDFIFAGRFIREKNLDLLIEAIRRIRSQGRDVSCLLVGDGPERDRLQGLSQRYHLEDSIRFPGFIEDHDQVLSLLKASRVFAFPSSREGYGIGALEALASGIPVVTLDHEMNAAAGFISESTGYLSSGSAEDLARTLLSALDNADSLSAGCRDYVRGLDWDTQCTALERYYAGIVEKHREGELEDKR